MTFPNRKNKTGTGFSLITENFDLNNGTSAVQIKQIDDNLNIEKLTLYPDVIDNKSSDEYIDYVQLRDLQNNILWQKFVLFISIFVISFL